MNNKFFSVLNLCLTILFGGVYTISMAQNSDPTDCFKSYWSDSKEKKACKTVVTRSLERVGAKDSVICGTASRIWKFEENTQIAVIEQPKQLRIARLKTDSGVTEIRGVTSIPVENHYFEKFDFAPFKITKDSYAFGIRRIVPLHASGGVGFCEELILFSASIYTDSVVEVFRDYMRYSMELTTQIREDGTRTHGSENAEAVLIVSRKYHNGFFELIRKSGKRRDYYRFDDFRYTKVSTPNNDIADEISEGCGTGE